MLRVCSKEVSQLLLMEGPTKCPPSINDIESLAIVFLFGCKNSGFNALINFDLVDSAELILDRCYFRATSTSLDLRLAFC